MSRYILFASALNAFVLFAVQPFAARSLLPEVGGTPTIWTICLVFFQLGLLLGYLIAHFVSEKLRLIFPLLGLALIALMFLFPFRFSTDAIANLPLHWIVVSKLLSTIGLPFITLSMLGPLVQKAYSKFDPVEQNHYLPYAASNFGSFAALFSYPFLLEPNWTLSFQGVAFGIGFVFCCLNAAGILMYAKNRVDSSSLKSAEKNPRRSIGLDERKPSLSVYAQWLVLALVPSALLASLSNYMSSEIAPIPAIWLIPLGIYLISYSLGFSRFGLSFLQRGERWLPLVILVLFIPILIVAKHPLWLVVLIHLLSFFWIAATCHAKLASLAPSVRCLTHFYLAIAVGGVVGSALIQFAAPLVFSQVIEYPLTLAVTPLLLLRKQMQSFEFLRGMVYAMMLLLIGGTLLEVESRSLITASPQLLVLVIFGPLLVLAYLQHSQPLGFTLSLIAILTIHSRFDGPYGKPELIARSPLGVYRVTTDDKFRYLVHGTTRHGQTSLTDIEGRQAFSYYYPTGPVGELFTEVLSKDERLDRVGVIGLGCGAMATFSQKGQEWNFYELDSRVSEIAANAKLFPYLNHAKGKVSIHIGDGRKLLEKEMKPFGCFVIDAFSSDSIPIHLLTVEAFRLYVSRLAPNGILLVHISNQYFDLEPVVALASRLLNCNCLIKRDERITESEIKEGKVPSDWMLITRDNVLTDRLCDRYHWNRGKVRPNFRAWKDDFANVWETLR